MDELDRRGSLAAAGSDRDLCSRIAVFAIGIWLIAMIVLGIALWPARRGIRTAKR